MRVLQHWVEDQQRQDCVYSYDCAFPCDQIPIIQHFERRYVAIVPRKYLYMRERRAGNRRRLPRGGRREMRVLQHRVDD